MKINYLFLVLFLVHFVGTSAQTMMYDGILRDYQVYTPPAYDSAVPSPLVINYHGVNSNAFEQRYYSIFDQVAADSNFIVVYPNGVNKAWNSGLVTQSTADDVGFTSALIDKLSTDYNINARRVYATGMSNGGFMSYRLGCELSNKIAAIASVTGALAEDIVTACQPNRPVPVMQIHGTADQIVVYNGFPNFHRGAEGSVNFWINRNNCNTVADTTVIPNIYLTDLSTAQRFFYGPCDGGTEVELYKIANGGHTWPDGSIDIPVNGNTNRDFNASRVVWEFFSRHSLPFNTNTEEIEAPAFEFSLSPNPFSDQLFITTDHQEPLQVVITDVLGKTIAKEMTIDGRLTMNMSELSTGVYFVTLSSDQQQFTRKIVKQ